MIKSLSIQNFQSHAKTELNFNEGVNVIVGTSDSGKTAIIRVLRWLVWNRPSGDALRSTWGGETRVRLGTEEGEVTRSKDKVDKYLLCHNGEEAIEFKAFGTSVPEEIQRLLNIGEVNSQTQLDSPFLLSESPGAVATHFNKVAKLDKIDNSIQNVQSWIRELETVIGKEALKGRPATGLIKQIQDAEIELTKLDYLDKFEIDVEVLEGMETTTISKRNTKEQLVKLTRSISNINTDIEELSTPPEYEELINSLLVYYKKIDSKNKVIQGLNDLVKEIQEVEEKIEKYSVIIASAALVDALIEFFAKITCEKTTLSALNTATNNIHTLKEQVLKTQKKAITLKERFNKEMPDICPLCDQPIKKK